MARLFTAITCCACLLLAACQHYPYQPDKATRAYPQQLKQVEAPNIQVIPDIGNGSFTVVNASPKSYTNFDLWLNRRYMRHVDELLAGQSVVLEVESFWDERGEGPFPGGWFRYYQPTPIVLVQIQLGPDEPLVGLATAHPINETR
jgi:hypothetical protein